MVSPDKEEVQLEKSIKPGRGSTVEVQKWLEELERFMIATLKKKIS